MGAFVFIILICAFLYFATGLAANIITILNFIANREDED